MSHGRTATSDASTPRRDALTCASSCKSGMVVRRGHVRRQLGLTEPSYSVQSAGLRHVSPQLSRPRQAGGVRPPRRADGAGCDRGIPCSAPCAPWVGSRGTEGAPAPPGRPRAAGGSPAAAGSPRWRPGAPPGCAHDATRSEVRDRQHATQNLATGTWHAAQGPARQHPHPAPISSAAAARGTLPRCARAARKPKLWGGGVRGRRRCRRRTAPSALRLVVAVAGRAHQLRLLVPRGAHGLQQRQVAAGAAGRRAPHLPHA